MIDNIGDLFGVRCDRQDRTEESSIVYFNRPECDVYYR